jgi:transcriptional regulator with XRE-family HTH domain
MGRPPKQPRTPFGERLYAARTAKGISQGKMAKLLGIGQSSYVQWERRRIALRVDQIQRLMSILSVRADYLFGESPKK